MLQFSMVCLAFLSVAAPQLIANGERQLCSGQGCGAPAEDFDETSLLQRSVGASDKGQDLVVEAEQERENWHRHFWFRRRRSSRAPSQAASAFTLAMEGGGWLAQSGFQALLVGVAARSQPSKSVTDLLSEFDALVSTSGSSWFTASMIYSEEYVRWMDSMKEAAASGDTDTLSTSWNDYYIGGVSKTLPPCSVSEAASFTLKLLAQMREWGYASPPILGREHLAMASVYEQAAAMVGAYEQAGKTLARVNSTPRFPGLDDLVVLSTRQACQFFSGDWGDTVARFMHGTANITKDALLGGQVLGWAAGKTWFATATVPARSVADTTFYPRSGENYVNFAGAKSLMYYAVGTHPEYIPAKFSWRLGSDCEQRAPYSFCADLKCLGVNFSYATNGSSTGGAAALGPAFEKAYTDASCKLPIVNVVAASSAFDGRSDVARSRKHRMIAVTGEAAIWSAGSGSGTAFQVGSDVRTSLDRVALAAQAQKASAATLHPLTDGGDTDQTGIAQAVAAGSRRIVSMQLAHRDGLPASFRMFDRGGKNGVGAIFAGETEDSMTAAFIAALQDSDFTINASAISPTSGLMHIVVLHKTFTTAENLNFGIKPNEKVSVDFVFIGTRGIGPGPHPPAFTMQKYGVLIEEVVALLQANRPFADMLRGILKGDRVFG